MRCARALCISRAHCTRQRRVPCNLACACKTVCRSARGTSLTDVAAVVPRDRLNAIRDRELNRFEELRPRGMKALERARARMPNGVPMAWMSVLYTHPPVVVDSGHGGGFTDVDGNAYLDFNLADTSMFTGYGVEAITRAVSERTAAGSQFLLPTEDAVEVAGRLAGQVRNAVLAVHVIGDAGQHRGAARSPRCHGPRRGTDVRR